MYGKFFASTFTGSMFGAGADVFAVWSYAIAHTVAGSVELNPLLLSATIGMDAEAVNRSILILCSPDSRSRSQEEEGRRLIHEGGYQYRVVNHAKYRAIRNDEERREYNRLAKRRSRERKAVKQDVIDGSTMSALSAHTEAEAEAEALPVPVDADDAANQAASAALCSALAEASEATGLSGLEILAEPSVRGKGSPITNPTVCPTAGRRLWEVTADRVRGFLAARRGDARAAARGRGRGRSAAPSWDRPDAAQATLEARAEEWISAHHVINPVLRSDIAVMAAEAPEEIRGSVAMILVARNPQLRE